MVSRIREIRFFIHMRKISLMTSGILYYMIAVTPKKFIHFKNSIPLNWILISHSKQHLSIDGCVTNTYENYMLSVNYVLRDSQLQYPGYLNTFKKSNLSLPMYGYAFSIWEESNGNMPYINYVLDFIYSPHRHRMSTWNQTILPPG